MEIVTQQNPAEQKIDTQVYDAIISAAGQHFVAYVHSPNDRFLELNSLRERPYEIDKETLLQNLEIGSKNMSPFLLVYKPRN